MLQSIMNRRKQRGQQLLQDFNQMRKLRNKLPNVLQFIVKDKEKEGAPNRYQVMLAVRSIIEITKYGAPVFQEGFRLEIILKSGYPQKDKPVLIVRPAIFHPHIKTIKTLVGRTTGIWIEPNERYIGLGDLILRVIRSLIYEPEFISFASTRIANRDALTWFNYWNSIFMDLNANFWFPTYELKLPDTTTLFTAKTFSIENTFPNDNHTVKSTRQIMANNNRKSFQIIQLNPPYEPQLGQIPSFLISSSSDFRGNCLTHKLFIKPKAVKQIFEHAQWGLKTVKNGMEQGGILVGRTIRDPGGFICGIVEEAVAGESAKGTSAYLEMDHETWKSMFDRVDNIMGKNPDDSLQIIGWYHTHPNLLDVFMSSTDRATQTKIFPNDWQFAVVLNPQKQIWRVFHDSNAEECQGYFIKNGN